MTEFGEKNLKKCELRALSCRSTVNQGGSSKLQKCSNLEENMLLILTFNSSNALQDIIHLIFPMSEVDKEDLQTQRDAKKRRQTSSKNDNYRPRL